jgi:hypothetical protein
VLNVSAAFIAPLIEQLLTVSIRSLTLVVRDKIKRAKKRSSGTSERIKLYANVTFISHFGNRRGSDVCLARDCVNFSAMRNFCSNTTSDLSLRVVSSRLFQWQENIEVKL